MTPHTTLTPGAPWPTAAELVAAIKSESCTIEVVRDVQAFEQERMAA